MKKGAKLMEDGYLVEIKDLDNNYWCSPMSTNSLRQAVSYADEKVQGMDSYLKVYRDFTATKGVYIAVFLVPNENPEAKPEHKIVKIRSFEVYTAAGIQDALDYMKREAKAEAQAPRKRSSSR